MTTFDPYDKILPELLRPHLIVDCTMLRSTRVPTKIIKKRKVLSYQSVFLNHNQLRSILRPHP